MLYRPDAPIKTPGPHREPSRIAVICVEVRRCFVEECCDARALPALAIWGGLAIVSLLAMLRQALGAPAVRLEIRQVWVASVAVVLLSVAAKQLLRLTGRVHPSLTIRSVAAVCGMLPLCMLAATTFGKLPANVTLCVAGMAAATGALLLLPTPVAGRSAARPSGEHASHAVPLGLYRVEEPHPSPLGPYIPPCKNNAQHRPLQAAESGRAERLPPASDQHAWQWMTRTQTANGGELIQGSTRAHFAAGEKQTVAHLAFIPPLSGMPEFACELADDCNARVKLVAAYPYGIRIELKRADCVPPMTVEIRYTASSQAAVKAA